MRILVLSLINELEPCHVVLHFWSSLLKPLRVDEKKPPSVTTHAGMSLTPADLRTPNPVSH